MKKENGHKLMGYRYTIGDKVIGFRYNSFGANHLFAGTITEIHDNSAYPDLDSVVIIEAEFPESPRSFNPSMDIYTDFDQDSLDKALVHQKKATELRNEAHYEEECITRVLSKNPLPKR